MHYEVLKCLDNQDFVLITHQSALFVSGLSSVSTQTDVSYLLSPPDKGCPCCYCCYWYCCCGLPSPPLLFHSLCWTCSSPRLPPQNPRSSTPPWPEKNCPSSPLRPTLNPSFFWVYWLFSVLWHSVCFSGIILLACMLGKTISPASGCAHLFVCAGESELFLVNV